MNSTSCCYCCAWLCRIVGSDSGSGADLELVGGYLEQLLPALAGASPDNVNGKLLRVQQPKQLTASAADWRASCMQE